MSVVPDFQVIGPAGPDTTVTSNSSDVPLGRLYRRLGRRYMFFWAGFGCVAAIPFPVTATLFMAWFRPLSSTQFVDLVVICASTVVLAVVGCFVGSWTHASTIHRWLRAGRPQSGAEAARAAAVHLPGRAVGSALAAGLPVAPIASWLAGRAMHFGAVGYVVIIVGGLVVSIWAAVLGYFTGELFMQPILSDAASRLPTGAQSDLRRLSLGAKLFGAMVAIGLVTSTGSAMLASHNGDVDHLALGLAASAAITTVVSTALTLLVVRTAIAPIHHLTGVTERVRAGDLSVRAHAVSADEMAGLATSLNAMLDGLRDRAVLHEAFGSYVDPEVADRILLEGQVLGATSWDATILFVDICGFTAYSERVTPQDAVARLDSFFNLIVPIVERHDGRVNKFVGDGLVAVYGDLGDERDGADQALRTAISIAAAVEAQFGEQLKVGIGLNSGPIVAGSVGGGGRLEYMLIGDPVNVASRVERLTRATGDTILLTDATRLRLSDRPAGLERRGEITVKGKSSPLRVYAVEP